MKLMRRKGNSGHLRSFENHHPIYVIVGSD
jgi:hypothetical protein